MATDQEELGENGLELDAGEQLVRANEREEAEILAAGGTLPEFQDDTPAWERQEGEPEYAFRCFLVYRDMRRWTDIRPRTMAELGRTLKINGQGSRGIFSQAKKWKWKERALAWDDYERHLFEDEQRAGMREIAASQTRLAVFAAKVAERGLAAAAKSWVAHGPSAAGTLRPEDAAKAAMSAATIMQQVVRPALPMELRNPDQVVALPGRGGPAQVTNVVTEAAAKAFIDAARRIADDERPHIDMGYQTDDNGQTNDPPRAIETRAIETTASEAVTPGS